MVVIILLAVIIALLSVLVGLVWKLNRKNMNKIKFDPKTGQTSIVEDVISSEIIEQTTFAAASDTDRLAEHNQDYCRTLFVPEANAKVIAIADGIGSAKYSEIGSRFVTGKALELIQKELMENAENIDFYALFANIQQALVKMIQKDYANELDSLASNSFGTTLILGIDTPDQFVTAYIGNGSVYHISGILYTHGLSPVY